MKARRVIMGLTSPAKPTHIFPLAICKLYPVDDTLDQVDVLDGDVCTYFTLFMLDPDASSPSDPVGCKYLYIVRMNTHKSKSVGSIDWSSLCIS
ncbi:hypothetical protein SUGI_0246160 [Cryptomeria japonica]|nr:hypothetical protein SUGI_0246160 [Cryptomeria japonica]